VSGRERRAMGRDRWGDIYANMPMRKMVALYDYDPQELSPNVDSEVSPLLEQSKSTNLSLMRIAFLLGGTFLSHR